MKVFVDKSREVGCINCDTEKETLDYLRKLAREFFLGNPGDTVYSVALIDFETREHSILEFEIETKIEVTEY